MEYSSTKKLDDFFLFMLSESIGEDKSLFRFQFESKGRGDVTEFPIDIVADVVASFIERPSTLCKSLEAFSVIPLDLFFQGDGRE